MEGTDSRYHQQTVWISQGENGKISLPFSQVVLIFCWIEWWECSPFILLDSVRRKPSHDSPGWGRYQVDCYAGLLCCPLSLKSVLMSRIRWYRHGESHRKSEFSRYRIILFKTTALLMGFILAMVLHPDVPKARREIDTVVGNDRLPTFSLYPT